MKQHETTAGDKNNSNNNTLCGPDLRGCVSLGQTPQRLGSITATGADGVPDEASDHGHGEGRCNDTQSVCDTTTLSLSLCVLSLSLSLTVVSVEHRVE